MEDKYCLTCFEKLKISTFREIVENKSLICDACLENIPVLLKTIKLFSCKITLLSKYDSVFQTYLKNYKEYKDFELRKVFLYPFLSYIKIKFHNYLFIPCPSSKKRIEERGFDHLEEILKVNNIKYKLLLKKNSNIMQKDNNLTNRFLDESISIIKGKEKEVENKKIVLFDDVLTTGNTFKNSLLCLRKFKPKKIVGLIIMDNYNVEKLKII